MVDDVVFLGRLRGCRQREQQGRSVVVVVLVAGLVVLVLEDEKKEDTDFCILPLGFRRHV